MLLPYKEKAPVLLARNWVGGTGAFMRIDAECA
jgi:hypothetical protein